MKPAIVACCQIPLAIGDTNGNTRRARAAIESAARVGADIVVLPELCNSGYVFANIREARALAEPASGPTVSGWLNLARDLGIIVVGGFCEYDDNGQLRNSAAIVDSLGVRTVYRKVHLWDREKLVFTPGDDPPPVVSTTLGRIGVTLSVKVVVT
jgi:predicted amidohydrolase